MIDLSRFNPITMKELRVRMRGSRAFIVMGAYVAVLLIAILISFSAIFTATTISGASVADLSSWGKGIFVTLSFLQLGMVMLVTPAFSAGAITTEKETHTLEAMRSTLLSERTIVIGKLLSSLAYILLLIVVSAPLLGVVFITGGVSPGEMLGAYAILVTAGATAGAFGILLSSRIKKTVSAVVMTYTVLIAANLLMLVLAADSSHTSLSNLISGFVLPLSPFLTMAGLFDPPLGSSAYFTLPRLGLPIPYWTAGIALGLLLIINFLASSSATLKTRETDTTPGVRISFLALYMVLMAAIGVYFINSGFVYGSISFGSITSFGPIMRIMIPCLMINLGVNLFLLCGFATGRREPTPGRAAAAGRLLNPINILRNRCETGPVYIFIMSLIVLAPIIPISTVWGPVAVRTALIGILVVLSATFGWGILGVGLSYLFRKPAASRSILILAILIASLGSFIPFSPTSWPGYMRGGINIPPLAALNPFYHLVGSLGEYIPTGTDWSVVLISGLFWDFALFVIGIGLMMACANRFTVEEEV